MRLVRGAVMGAGLLALLLTGTDAAQAQRRGAQAQQRIHQTDQMTRRMDGLEERVRVMDREMVREMDGAEGPQRNAEWVRTRERVRNMSDAVGQMARHMRATMVHMREMEGDPRIEGDPQMQQEMERLRQHLRLMGDELEQGVQTLERLHQRLRVAQP